MSENQENPLNQLLILNQISAAMDSVLTGLTKTKCVDFGKVVSYEMTEIEEKENGKTVNRPAVILTLASGAEIELTKEENTVFRQFLNMKIKVDAEKFAYASGLFNAMFPPAPINRADLIRA